jgi:hypothetical protein
MRGFGKKFAGGNTTLLAGKKEKDKYPEKREIRPRQESNLGARRALLTCFFSRKWSFISGE